MASRPAGARWGRQRVQGLVELYGQPGPAGFAEDPAPYGEGGGDRTVYLALVALVAQEGQVGYCLAAVGEQVPHGRNWCSALAKEPVRPVASARSASRRDRSWLTTA